MNGIPMIQSMQTTTKHNIIVIAVSTLMAISVPFIYRPVKKERINYKTFHSGPGWGYDIIMNGKLVIHQEWIPAIAEKKEFLNETQAKQTANLVILKLKNNKTPTLSKAEVDQICGTNN